MDRQTIIEKIGDLPSIPLGKVAEDHEIWEVTEGGAHCKVTRQPLPVANLEFLALSVSGEPGERERIIKDFTAALGEPQDRSVLPAANQDVDMVAWLIKP